MIEFRQEKARGCGYRVPGGYYMVAGPRSFLTCPWLPRKIKPCPTCKHVLKFSRAVQLVRACEIKHIVQCSGALGKLPITECPGEYFSCPLIPENWASSFLVSFIGRGYYIDWDHFRTEAEEIGISRRLNGKPKWWDGKSVHWCLMVYDGQVFAVAHIDAIEYVVKESDGMDVFQHLVEKDITPVNVQRVKGKFSRQNEMEF